jgi:hypothetical protein
MSGPKHKSTPTVQPTASGGPPRPPKRTSKGFGDQPPEETKIRVIIPKAIEGDVLLYLTTLRGAIMNIQIERPAWTVIEALISRCSVPDFTTWLHDFSKGEGRVSEEPK